MVQYIILAIAFQILFLLVYDILLKKATFFNLNRFYLLVTPLVSMLLPFIRISRLHTPIPKALVLPDFAATPTPEQTIQLQEVTLTAKQQIAWLPNFSIWQWAFIAGVVISSGLFLYKYYQILKLKKQGKKIAHQDYTEIITPSSTLAFSFFRNMFLGDLVKQKEHQHIIAHELVHIKQKHSWDHLYFELLKIVFWFNPVIYMYQNRMRELHEYIADSRSGIGSKKQQYQWLLQEAFDTENISFINQFFNKSLIKKRIVMLQKSKSRKRELFKYSLVLPVIGAMLLYVAACTQDDNTDTTPVTAEQSEEAYKQQILKEVDAEIATGKKPYDLMSGFLKTHDKNAFNREDFYRFGMITYRLLQTANIEKSDRMEKMINDAYNITYEEYLGRKKTDDFNTPMKSGDIPYTITENKPVFPGCEDAEDKDMCFKQKLDEHVRNNFTYPIEAQQANIQGRVYINFRITKEGTIEVLNTRGPSKSLQDEAERIINLLPHLTPGTDEAGNPINVTFAYPIVFKLK